MGEISSEFREECLRIHNEYRTVHDSPALALDKKLNEFAQTRATLFADGDYVSLGESIPYGENVYMRRSTDQDFKISAEEPVQSWLMRRKYHVFGEPQPANLSVVKKFTQLVWKNTKKLGVGMVTSSNGTIYVVCNYDPAGNEEDQFADNVLPAKEEDGAEVETPETVELRSVEPQEKVVESLDRLYAVPSEKLRVWTVWLCKIGDEASEWYKWIHVHSDLIVRMSDYLRTIEEKEKEEVKAEDSDKRMSKPEHSQEEKDTEERESKSSVGSEDRSSKLSGTERGSKSSKSKERDSRTKSKDSAGSSDEKFYDARTSSELAKETQSEAAAAEEKKSVESERFENDTTTPKESRESKTPEDEAEKPEESRESKTAEDGAEKPEGSVVSKPSESVTEAEDAADVFARESVQTEQEVPVESTESEDAKKESKASESDDAKKESTASESEDAKKESNASESEDAKKESQASERESEATVSSYDEDELPVGVKWKPLGESEEEEEKEEEIELLEIPRCREEMILYKKDFMYQATIYISLYEHWKETAAQAIKELMGRQVMPTSEVSEINGKALLRKYEGKTGKKFTETEDMKAFIRDMARAEEDIPYIFYLKVEPNIDIAIEFGAEDLYELPRREHIYGDSECLYFNLVDKPGTLDEPESLKNKPIKEENKDETD